MRQAKGLGPLTHDDANSGVTRPRRYRPVETMGAWVRKHDPNLVALRRAARTAIIMPGLFALSIEVIGNVQVATFAAFGSIALLMLVDFSGSIRARLQAQVAFSATGAILVCLGTLTSQKIWLSVTCMAVVAFVVIFAGVVSSTFASATTALLLVFILSTAVPGPPSVIPDRLAGWAMAAVVSFFAVWLLWPARVPNSLRKAAAIACRAVAALLREDVSNWLGADSYSREKHELISQAADDAVEALHRSFLAAPWRPTGLSTSSRAVVRLVDEIHWLGAQVIGHSPPTIASPVMPVSCHIHSASASVLEAGAAILDQPPSSSADLEVAVEKLRAALETMESEITLHVPSFERQPR